MNLIEVLSHFGVPEPLDIVRMRHNRKIAIFIAVPV